MTEEGREVAPPEDGKSETAVGQVEERKRRRGGKRR